MTLALIFFVFSFTASGQPANVLPGNGVPVSLVLDNEGAPGGALKKDAQVLAAPLAPVGLRAAQDPGSAPQTQTPSSSSKPEASTSSPAQTPEAGKPATPAKRAHRNKKTATVNCNPPAVHPSAEHPSAEHASETHPASASESASSGSGSAPAKSAAPVAPSGAAPTATNCPPTKTIVRQGGSSEPSIQLVGGQGGIQAVQQRDSANQLLESTEANLKKIDERRLTSNQQDMVNQIHEFMAQSKSAVAAGDLERARTLAWKAQLLSQELVKPQQ
jgi:hypothetical protein